jgi:hypothetical protein
MVHHDRPDIVLKLVGAMVRPGADQ